MLDDNRPCQDIQQLKLLYQRTNAINLTGVSGRRSIEERELSVVKDNFANNGYAFAHGIYRMTALVGALRNLNELLGRRGAIYHKDTTEALGRVRKILGRKSAT
jgi:hypothetical protein